MFQTKVVWVKGGNTDLILGGVVKVRARSLWIF